MTIKDQLMEDFKVAMKAHDDVAKNTISLARAAIKQHEIDNKEVLDDAGVTAILTKQVKMRKDALADFEKAGRTDLLDAYKSEIAVLQKYLPEPLTKDELKKIVEETATSMNIESGMNNMGKLMGSVMAKVKGRADGGIVKKIVTDFLS